MDIQTEEDGPTDLNTIVFKLKVKCEYNPDASPDETDPKKKFIHSHGMFYKDKVGLDANML